MTTQSINKIAMLRFVKKTLLLTTLLTLKSLTGFGQSTREIEVLRMLEKNYDSVEYYWRPKVRDLEAEKIECKRVIQSKDSLSKARSVIHFNNLDKIKGLEEKNDKQTGVNIEQAVTIGKLNNEVKKAKAGGRIFGGLGLVVIGVGTALLLLK